MGRIVHICTTMFKSKKKPESSDTQAEITRAESKYGNVKIKNYAELGDLFPMEDEDEGEEDYFSYYDNVTEDYEGEDDEHDEEGESDAASLEDSQVSSKSKLKALKGLIKWPKLSPNKKANRERKEILLEAKRLGDSRTEPDPRQIVIIYNPVSGNGTAKKLVFHMVAPVFELCKVKYSTVETQYRGFATEYMQKLDPSTVQGIVIAGGDGLVHEVITGYFLNPDHRIREIPVGITPSGTANAMAHELHRHSSKTQVSIVGRAALAVAKGHTRPVDVLEVNGEHEKIYALSVFGWGMAGAVALKADKLRWIPGQKKSRYDIAGAVTMLADWPVIDSCKFEYLKETRNPITKKIRKDWKTEDLDCINMVATNMPFLGNDHPIYEHIGPDDGHAAVVFVKGSCSRRDVISLALDMKKGIYLANDTKRCKVFRTTEFKLTPTKARSPFNIDGDPHDHCRVHVKVLHQALNMYTLPERGETLAEHVANSGMPLPLAVAGVKPTQLNPKKAGKKSPEEEQSVSALASALFVTSHGD